MRPDSVGASGPFKVFGTVGVSCTFQVTSSSVQQCLLFVQVLAFNRFLSQVHGATFVLLCPTLVLVTPAIAFACRQLVKNMSKYSDDDPRGARAVSKLGVVRGLSLTATRQVAHPPLVQQVLHQHCELLQSSCKLWRPPRENFSQRPTSHSVITFRHVQARSVPLPTWSLV